VLGPVELLINGDSAPAELLWRKNLALLVYLARSPKRTRSRDHLVGLLWGDKADSAARHSLNEAMRVLRKHLGAESLEGEGDQIRLSPDAVRLDLEQFESLTAQEDWQAVADLAVGDFMEGFSIPGCSAFEDWLHGERVTWREKSVDALVKRAAELTDGGELREAAAVARRAIALDPTSSVATEAAMRSLAIAGDRAAALQVYDAFASHLEEEVRIAPDDRVQGLAGRIRRERAWNLPEALAADRLPGAESRRVPLVGREAELEQLIDAWSSCREEGRATLAVVEGEPGTGKTRIVRNPGPGFSLWLGAPRSIRRCSMTFREPRPPPSRSTGRPGRSGLARRLKRRCPPAAPSSMSTERWRRGSRSSCSWMTRTGWTVIRRWR
jgi:DNA-binding SARP family transcriptional activator